MKFIMLFFLSANYFAMLHSDNKCSLVISIIRLRIIHLLVAYAEVCLLVLHLLQHAQFLLFRDFLTCSALLCANSLLYIAV